MGDICTLCEGPHPTRHHGVPDDTPPPQGVPAIKWCPECEDYHPRGWPCVLVEADDGGGVMEWHRSGTLLAGGVIEIDLTDGWGSWITVKGDSDADSERIAFALLTLLNGEAPDAK